MARLGSRPGEPICPLTLRLLRCQSFSPAGSSALLWRRPRRVARRATGLDGYPRSKTLAEKDAWAIAQASDGALTLTTILPGMVLGPALGPQVSGSLELPLRMLAGRLPLLPRISFAGVHTDDVVALHIQALTDPRARGERIIAAADSLWLREIAQVLKDRFAERASNVSVRAAPDWLIRAAAWFSADARFMAPDLGKLRSYSSAKATMLLGRPLRSSRDAVTSAGESLIALGLA